MLFQLKVTFSVIQLRKRTAGKNLFNKFLNIFLNLNLTKFKLYAILLSVNLIYHKKGAFYQ